MGVAPTAVVKFKDAAVLEKCLFLPVLSNHMIGTQCPLWGNLEPGRSVVSVSYRELKY